MAARRGYGAADQRVGVLDADDSAGVQVVLAGPIAQCVELDATLQGAAVMLRVRDDGPGFPPDFIASAFERFTRADSARGRSPSGTRADSARGRSSSGTPADSAPARGGAGLGLAIVEAIAVAHGGRAGARNRKGAGAEIWIEIPLRSDAEAGAGA